MNWVIEGIDDSEFKRIAARLQAEAVIKYVIENAREYDELPELDLRDKNFLSKFAEAYEILKENNKANEDWELAEDRQSYEAKLNDEFYDFARAVFNGQEPKPMSLGLQMAIRNGYSKRRWKQLQRQQEGAAAAAQKGVAGTTTPKVTARGGRA